SSADVAGRSKYGAATAVHGRVAFGHREHNTVIDRENDMARCDNGQAMDDDQRSSNDKVDEALEGTFPASDPPANTVEVGIRVKAEALSNGVVANNDSEPDRSRG